MLEPQGDKNDKGHIRTVNFVTKAYYWFVGTPEELAMQVANDERTATTNVIVDRAMQRALKVATQQAVIEHLGKLHGLPYWRVNRHQGTISEAAQAAAQETMAIRVAEDPEYLRVLAYGGNLSMDLINNSELTAAERAELDAFAMEKGFSSDQELASHFWLTNNILKRRVGLALSKNPIKQRTKEYLEKLTDGFAEITGSDEEQFHLIIFVLAMFMLMATAGTIYGAPFYALGIEIAPSYHGRTKVVMVRSWFSKILKMVFVSFLPFVLLPIFYDASEGGYVLASVMLVFATLASIVAFIGTKEHPLPPRAKEKKPGFFVAIKEIGRIPEFWRVTGLYILQGQILGLFGGLSVFIVTYYMFEGNLLMGAAYNSVSQMIMWFIGFAQLPLIQWLCGRYGKHTTIMLGLLWLIIGTCLKFVCHNPEHPELLWILPFFYGLGIGTFRTVLQTLMGDVTDVDELRNGERREAMFGAVMAIITKSVSAVGALFSGVVVVLSGFEIEKGYYQDPGVYTTMLWMFSVIPGVLLVSCFPLIWRYPLTKERMAEIKEELAIARKQRAEG